MKLKRTLILFIIIAIMLSVSGVSAQWIYFDTSVNLNISEDLDYTLSDYKFAYQSEVVITKITPVSSTLTSESGKFIQPTKVNSTITGNKGQKITYKVNAHNYSTTNTFIYSGADYDTGAYSALNKLSISVSQDAQGTVLMNESVSSNAHRGTPIAPGEDFVFYVTYTLTDKVSASEILVNYTFKPIIYTITYLHNNQTFAIEYITDNSVEYKVITEKPVQSGVDFAGWINASAAVVNSIPKNNTNDYTLSASWDDVYIIIFADVNGNVLYEEQFTSSATSISSQGQATVDQILADLNTQAGEDMSVSWSDYTIKGAKEDIVVKAVYNYDGYLNLVPVDSNNDGIIDYYQVEAVDTLDEEVRVPGYVGKIPVTLIKRITNVDGSSDWDNFEEQVKVIIIEEGVVNLGEVGSNTGNALAWTPNLKRVVLPSTIEWIGKNTFSRNIALGGFGRGDDKKTLTIEYNGTKEQWNAISKHEDWANGLLEGSIIQCTNGSFKLEKSGLFGTSLKWVEY